MFIEGEYRLDGLQQKSIKISAEDHLKVFAFPSSSYSYFALGHPIPMKSGPDRAEMLRSRLNHQYPDYFAPNLSCQVYFGGVVCGKAHQVDNEWTPFCFPACFWRAKLSNARMNLTPVPRGIAFTWKKSTPLRRATRPEETGCPAEWGTPPRM